MISAIRVTFSLTRETKNLLFDLAQTEHRTMSQIVRDAIDLYKKAKELSNEK